VSAISLILLATAGTAMGLGVAALRTARGLRADVSALRAELTREPTTGHQLPAPRTVPAQEIRSAVAEALAAERERELAEARAYWAEQEVGDGEGPASLLAGGGLDHGVAAEADEELLDALLERYLLSDSGSGYPSPAARDGVAFVPRQPTVDSVDGADGSDGVGSSEGAEQRGECGGAPGADDDPAASEAAEAEEADAAELAAARRRHPSHPGYTLTGEPVDEPRRTAARLAQLAESRTPLVDVRPGPLGTLDVYLFADGTTLCLSPGHQQAAERLAEALRTGEPPVLMGGSGLSGAYALTFSCGQESVYLLVDRVVATSRQR
jgi:hypothetical protein